MYLKLAELSVAKSSLRQEDRLKSESQKFRLKLVLDIFQCILGKKTAGSAEAGSTFLICSKIGLQMQAEMGNFATSIVLEAVASAEKNHRKVVLVELINSRLVE